MIILVPWDLTRIKKAKKCNQCNGDEKELTKSTLVPISDMQFGQIIPEGSKWKS